MAHRVAIRRLPDDCSRIKLDSRFIRAMEQPLSPYLKAANEKLNREFNELAAKLKAYFERR